MNRRMVSRGIALSTGMGATLIAVFLTRRLAQRCGAPSCPQPRTSHPHPSHVACRRSLVLRSYGSAERISIAAALTVATALSSVTRQVAVPASGATTSGAWGRVTHAQRVGTRIL